MKDTKIRIKPLGDKILVKEFSPDEKTKKTASGIILPSSVNEDKGSKQGKVMAIGSGKYIEGKLIPLEVKVGDTVIFQWGDKIIYEGQEYFMVTESSVSGIIK